MGGSTTGVGGLRTVGGGTKTDVGGAITVGKATTGGEGATNMGAETRVP